MSGPRVPTPAGRDPSGGREAGLGGHPAHRLLRVGLKGKSLQAERIPASNLVFLIDVSGSMNGFPLDTAKKLRPREPPASRRHDAVAEALSDPDQSPGP